MNWPKPKRVCLLLAALEENIQPQVRQGHEILVQACSSKSGSNLFDKVVNWASNPIAGQTKEERDSATRRRQIKFRQNIEDAVKALEDDSLLFVVYTGHGELTRENYVCVPGSSFVVEEEVIKAAAETKCRSLKLLFMPICCRSTIDNPLEWKDKDCVMAKFAGLQGTYGMFKVCPDGETFHNSLPIEKVLARHVRTPPSTAQELFTRVEEDIRACTFGHVQPEWSLPPEAIELYVEPGEPREDLSILSRQQVQIISVARLSSFHFYELVKQHPGDIDAIARELRTLKALFESETRDCYRIADLRAQNAVLRRDDLASACQAAVMLQTDIAEVDDEMLELWSDISSDDLEWFYTSLCNWLRTPNAADSQDNIQALRWLLEDLAEASMDDVQRERLFQTASCMNPPLVLNPPWSTVRGHHSQNCRPLEPLCVIPKPGTVGSSGQCQLRDEEFEELWTWVCKQLSIKSLGFILLKG